jgi:hypothetical protein
MAIIPSCAEFLAENAIGQWFETYRFKNEDDYIHPVNRDMVLLRVELGAKRAFYWIYNIKDAIEFNQYVGITLKGEAHEILISNSCRFFYDIDLKLDATEQQDFAEHYGYENETDATMNAISHHLANVFQKATLISLEEHDNDLDDELYGFDWMYTTRNRRSEDGFKISIHLITNIFVSLRACAAIAEDVKLHAIEENVELLGISASIAHKLCESIDETQYRLRGSLGLPFGTKQSNGSYCTNFIQKEYGIPNQYYLITIEDPFTVKTTNLSKYNIVERSTIGKKANPQFVQKALQHVNNIPDYNPRVWDLQTSILKRSTMFVKRYAPSHCSICKRDHDNDNTLFLIFNSDYGIASWKCARMPSMKPIIFFQDTSFQVSAEEADDEPDNDLDAFMNKFTSTNIKDVVKQDIIPNASLTTTTQSIVRAAYEPDHDLDEIDAFVKKCKPHTFDDFGDDDDPTQHVKSSAYTKPKSVRLTKISKEYANAPIPEYHGSDDEGY